MKDNAIILKERFSLSLGTSICAENNLNNQMKQDEISQNLNQQTSSPLSLKKMKFSSGNSSVYLKKCAVFCGWHLLKKSLMENYIFSAVILSHTGSSVSGLEAKSNYCHMWKTGPYLMRCMTWYHFYNLKKVKNIHEGLLLLVPLQAFSLQLY